jgi:hypothetical protein
MNRTSTTRQWAAPAALVADTVPDAAQPVRARSVLTGARRVVGAARTSWSLVDHSHLMPQRVGDHLIARMQRLHIGSDSLFVPNALEALSWH